MASIVFSADQFVNTPAEPPSPTCTASMTNTASCDHTDIATQTTGPGVFQKHKGFEVEGRDLETSDSGHPEMDLAISNTDTQAITSVSVLLAGTNLALNWNPSLPILPGATTSASTTALQSLSLVLGVYDLSITATMADGSTVTQTFSVIYTPLIGPF